jgi:hypothetical protein
VTECALTAATAPDGPTGVELLADEAPGLEEVPGDTHYGSGETRAALRTAGHTQTIKPLPLSSAVPGGFTTHQPPSILLYASFWRGWSMSPLHCSMSLDWI